MNEPATSECQREDCPDGSGLHDRTECLCKVHTRTLGESSEDLAGLVMLESPVGIELVLENPLPGDRYWLTEDEAQDPRCGSSARRHVLPP